jgi:hypothetical protein
MFDRKEKKSSLIASTVGTALNSFSNGVFD